MEKILTYFPNLSDKQRQQFELLLPTYKLWNDQINVVSRKDIDELYLRHVLHSLAIAKIMEFKAGSAVLDLGTGGGFPGIPLAILFPDSQFTLVDSIGKKIKVVNEVATALGLTNVKGIHARVEELKNQKYDFVTSRAVAELRLLLSWSRKLIKSNHHINPLPNGWLILKGGDLKEELAAVSKGEYIETTPITDFFKDAFFEEKFVLYVQG
ncbi:MAG: hypothetical protein RLZZ292_899 [Bacteroidota bacterium]|jgi:16S rRNA (guanine527-N7)-methyltransferase